jgi:diphthamide biosynthesis protein 7
LKYEYKSSSKAYITRETIHTHATDYAILDLHCSPHCPDVFCSANSTNSISFYGLRLEVTKKNLGPIQPLCTIETFPQNSLVLSFQWHPIHANQLGVSLSTGEVMLCQLDTDLLKLNTKTTMLQTCVLRHELEAWILGFTPSGTGIFSGGDDGVLQFAELRTANMNSEQQADADSSHALWQNRNLHGAGVTALLPLFENVCITGSYDDHIRILSTPRSGRKTVVAELDLGGGVWRLLPIEPWDSSWEGGADLELHVLASCMHAGARILRVSRSAGAFKIEVLAMFQEHESMNYGSSFWPVVHGKELVVVSTSFYDKLVCLWKFRLD